MVVVVVVVEATVVVVVVARKEKKWGEDASFCTDKGRGQQATGFMGGTDFSSSEAGRGEEGSGCVCWYGVCVTQISAGIPLSLSLSL